ncbi:hypothetical protein [Streptosporangium carneum]|uniref:Uncharacterized protein n=1 Tax=Streptosporangium carneum TaxID=47481 RepID=A0A9W6I0K3_9ACTN|nr:hypothetical protein [Streptosporangium carneum]GLK09797.1 hypothetical protein GCM10017600_32030 [Streptosporangium carneum]
MTHQPAVDGDPGQEEGEPLPRRLDAPRCPHTDADRRCVLPSDHELGHVYPHRKAAEE